MKEEKTEWTLKTLKKYLDIKIDGNDRRYEQKFASQDLAVKDALAAQKELTAAAFASSEKAIVKAEDAQRDYNLRSNEFRGQLDDQAKRLMPRSESDTKFQSQEEKIAEQRRLIELLSTRLTSIESRGRGANALWGYVAGAIGLIFIIISIFKTIK